MGTGLDQFNYTGGVNWMHGAGSANDYMMTLSNDNVAGESVTIAFTGTSIVIYGTQNANLGITGFILDNGAPVTFDQYNDTPKSQVVLYTSPPIAPGMHSLQIVVTGQKNGSSVNTYTVIDYARITS